MSVEATAKAATAKASAAGAAPVQTAQEGGEKFARTPAFEWFSRAGFVARAAIYLIIGVLALELAVGVGGRATNQQGALETIARQPFGKVLLILVAIGLAGYATWRLIRAALGHGPEESDSGMDRVTALASGIVYAGLCAIAIQILLGSGGGNSSGQTHKATAGVLGWPGGTWLVGLAGVILIGVGLFQGYRAFSRDFLEDAKVGEMSPRVQDAYSWIGSFGYMARMVVFCIVGAFLIKAAVEFDPNKAVGLDGALAKVAHQAYGHLLLGVVAAGLIAFGVYSLADARYRRI
jgi:Domain of Unknown Function (DUF1206)